jgi:hypothetical protein
MTGAPRLAGGYEISGQVRMANRQYAAARLGCSLGASCNGYLR